MIDEFIQKFLENPTENTANDIIFKCRTQNLFNIGVKFGDYIQ